MKIIKSIKYLKRIVKESKRNGSSINFIPTMGALHLGHIKLIQKAKKRNAVRIVSIFINPSQFGPSEDFKNYPRTIHNDLNLLRNEDVDIVFLPIENEILKYKTFYKCPNFKIENILCGKSRPNYFPGVKNIVIKLFDIVQADNSFFGEKDYQQLVVIKKLRDELNFGTKIIPIKTVRNKNGLPLSSRNKYLEINEIEIANKINKICKYLIPKVKNKLNTTKILAHAKRELRMNGIDKIDYLTILTDTLEKRRSLKSKSRIFIAANVGSTRLIDNFPI
ncbi:MAG: pantoate--beta-alanine ligase [Candidatus Pelagibacterales bacterium]|jgi:pantoate--beta-alanine ligase|tara:strand:+ start:284 stop:1117 length:834 start_codon:yes stop_codon:yes gene_type:complete